jgi:hypothetical protein
MFQDQLPWLFSNSFLSVHYSEPDNLRDAKYHIPQNISLVMFSGTNSMAAPKRLQMFFRNRGLP